MLFVLRPFRRFSVKQIIPSTFLVAAIGLFIAWNPSDSLGLRTEEGKAGHIRVKNGSATMYAYKDYLITQEQRAVGSEGIPTEIRIGDLVQVKDQRIKVNHIFWTRYLERAQYGKEVLAEVGDIQCVLVETPEDLPYSDEYRNRRWILVKKCEVIKEVGSTKGTTSEMQADLTTAVAERPPTGRCRRA